MLQKIVCIKNVGRFRNCAAAGDVSFRRVTMIFAENGRGKTTLCAILRSLCANTPALVVGRATLGSGAPPEVNLLLSSGNAVFRDGVWSASFQEISVFDGAYISDNVYAGEIVDTEQRRNLYRVIIGAEGVTLAARLNELDAEIRTRANQIRVVRDYLRQQAAPVMGIEAFISLPEDQEIEAKITAKTQELDAVRRAAELSRRAGLESVDLPSVPASLMEVLGKTIEHIAVDAERRVTDHIERHHMGTAGQRWLSDGLGFVAEESCPFCGQTVAGIELIQAYRGFFSNEYDSLRKEVSRTREQMSVALGERVAAGIEQVILKNDTGVEFWRKYCTLAPPVLPEAGRVARILAALREAARYLLHLKESRPLERVSPEVDFTEALAGFEELRVSLASYNAAVAAANAMIEARRRGTQGLRVREVEAELAKLNAQKMRHSEESRKLCADEKRLQAEKQALETEKSQARDRLDMHTTQVITQYGRSINQYLDRINAGFRITIPTYTYRGGTPSTSYQIVINESAVDLGDPMTPTDRPSFRNTLSAGDRSTLALAFFLAQLEQDSNRSRKVIVFDDPFTSLDSFRRSHTVHQIYRCAEGCAQVIVLSHDPNFLKLLWDRVTPNDRKTLQLARVGEENTAVAEWDIEKAVQARYRADIDVLQRFYADGVGERRDVIQKLRPVLEGYCRNLFPTQFADQDSLGVMIGKIRAVGSTHQLHPIVDDLEELNTYCRRYHHSENANAATEQIDDSELQGYVRRTLGLVGCLL